jgi:hypothetical protein
MSRFGELQSAAQFGAGLQHFFRQRLTLAQAQDIVRVRLEQRSENFLRLMERGVYGHAASPYRALLLDAGCEWQDLRRYVNEAGLETTLRQLRDTGVYVTFEEFKGRVPLVRNGKTISQTAHAFDNPFRARHFVSETGGSTGAAIRIAHDLAHQAAMAPHHLLVRAAHDVLHLPFAIWRGILPDGSGINNILHPAPFGQIPEKWFSQLSWRAGHATRKQMFFTYWFVLMGRVAGAPIPLPRYTPLERAAVVAQWVHDALQKRGGALLGTQVSRALRVALAAQDRNWDLCGATFMIAGEPPTRAKVAAIQRSGARVFPTYGMAEVGRIAMGCAHAVDVNDTHVLSDAFALFTHPVPVPGFEVTVPAFHITTLLDTTPKIMLNVVSDDYGVMQDRACGCLLAQCGYATHLLEIRSVNKLTGEGITLVGSEIVNVLEQVLPARFGGSSLDYQLQELEDAQGFTRLALRISPRVPIADEAQVISVLLNTLADSSPGGKAMSATLAQAGTVTVLRAAPIWTARGKFMPLHLKPSVTARKERP